MEIQDHQFPPHSRIKLKGSIDTSLYNGYACVGNEGWVREQRLQKYGYPEVWVEWDKDHWAYNGVADGWTYESHFDLVEGKMKEEKPVSKLDALYAKTRAALEEIEAAMAEEDGIIETSTAPVYDEETKIADTYRATLREIFTELEDSEAIIVVALQHEDGILFPRVVQTAKDPIGEEIINTQLAYLVAKNYESLLKKRIENGVESER